MSKPEHIYPQNPRKQGTPISKQMFATIVCLIPYGEVTTCEAIYEMWARRQGADYCNLEVAGLLPFTKDILFHPEPIARVDLSPDNGLDNDADKLIPYWRLVSERGYLIDFGTYVSKETQKERLEAEGHTIIAGREGTRSYRLASYKDKMFDLSRLVLPQE